MEFGTPARKRSGESIVPMINVVFLLLVFFLMTATIAPPDPFATQPPVAGAAEVVEADDVLFVGPAGEIALGDVRGQAAFGVVMPGAPLLVRADARLPATQLASVLARLAEAGVTEISLAAVTR